MHIITRHRKQRISQHNKNITTTQSKWNEHKTNDTERNGIKAKHNKAKAKAKHTHNKT